MLPRPTGLAPSTKVLPPLRGGNQLYMRIDDMHTQKYMKNDDMHTQKWTASTSTKALLLLLLLLLLQE